MPFGRGYSSRVAGRLRHRLAASAHKAILISSVVSGLPSALLAMDGFQASELRPIEPVHVHELARLLDDIR